MYKHHDLISINANNKMEARQKTVEFLTSYQKEDIVILGVEGANNHFEVEVQYYDRYESNSVFNTLDFIFLKEEDIQTLKLTI